MITTRSPALDEWSLSATLQEELLAATQASELIAGPRVQRLWSGYGEIRRVVLRTAQGSRPIIVKIVRPHLRQTHRRGFESDFAHRRKLRSYAVEQRFYRDYASTCGTPQRDACRLPAALHSSEQNGELLLALEDLDAAGFDQRRDACSLDEVRACLTWLSRFHARFMGTPPAGLWDVGTYWHLATRPDELAAIGDHRLRAAAPVLDAILNRCQFQTLLHGDAKVENFCFSASGAVSAVDFQYVGGGCGMKDVAYLLSSCLSAPQCAAHAEALLGHYFAQLQQNLSWLHPLIDADAVIAEWQSLYPVAWADFVRFLAGWAPDHYKLHAYSLAMTEQALAMSLHHTMV